MTQKTNCGIYQIRNLVNGKKYIGQTRDLTNRKKKWPNDLKPNSTRYNQHIKNSFAKYGEENFDFTKLVENCQESELDDLEIANILLHDAEDPNFGYNKDSGGKSGRPTKETIEKNRLANSGENNWINKLTPEEREELSIRKSESQLGEKNHMFGVKGEKHHFYGKNHKKETLKQISKTRIEKEISKGKNNPNYNYMLDNCKEEILFIHYNTDFTFQEIGELFNCDRHTISARIEKWS